MAITRIEVGQKLIQTFMGEAEVVSGRYWLPSFQRDYVWDSDKVKELLDSIFRNYPIGSVILWRPSSKVVSDIDPTSIPLIDTKNSSPEPHFVIDGQQRLTSLLLMFNNWQITRNGVTVKCGPISYNPTNDEFIKSSQKGIDFSKIIKAFCLFDMVALNEIKQSTSPEVFERIKEKAQLLLKYPISYYVMETDVENEATFYDMANAFIRINKEGVKIGNIELMLSFMAGTIGGDLKQKIVAIDKNMHGRFETALQPTMRFIFSNFGLTQSQLSNVKRFESNIKKVKLLGSKDRDEILSKSDIALNITLDFLETETGIKTAKMLPSQVTLIPLAVHIYKRGITSVAGLSNGEKKDMLNWFVLSNFLSHYGRAVDSRLNRDIQVIMNNASNDFPFKQLLEENVPAGDQKITYADILKGLESTVLIDAGRRFLFLLYIILAKQGADDWSGKLLSSRMLSDLERHHIFPQEHLREIFPQWENEDPDDVENEMSNLGNITWILGSVNSTINANDPVEYLPQYWESAKHHFVPEDQHFWTKEGFNAFKKYRVREIYLAGQKLFTNIFTDENPPVINIEDEPKTPSNVTDEHIINSINPDIIPVYKKIKDAVFSLSDGIKASYFDNWIRIMKGNKTFAVFGFEEKDKPYMWVNVFTSHEALKDILKKHEVHDYKGRPDIKIENGADLDEVVEAVKTALEVGESYDEDFHYKKVAYPAIIFAYKKLREMIIREVPDMQLHFTKSYIAFQKDNKSFVYVYFKKSKIIIWFEFPYDSFMGLNIIKNHETGKNKDGTWTNITIENDDNFSEIVNSIKGAYKIQFASTK